MIIIRSDPNTLQHYGVMGMRWGIRKDSVSELKENLRKKIATAQEHEKVLQEQARNIAAKKRTGNLSDRFDTKLSEYASQTLKEKVISETLHVGMSMAVSAVFDSAISGKQLTMQTLLDSAVKSVKNRAIDIGAKELSSRRLMQRYDKMGNKKPGSKSYKRLNPEAKLYFGVKAAAKFAPRVAKFASKRVSSIRNKRQEARIADFMDTRFSDYSVIYENGNMSVLERNKP